MPGVSRKMLAPLQDRERPDRGPKRGLHNIDDEIRFRSRPGFVFHDSCGVKAGSATELSTVQQFVDNRSLRATDLQTQLHAIWMCLPLDDCRELFESEKHIFQVLKGTAPLVVIFTKHDGAVSKETSQILMDFPENTRNRSIRKEARSKAELQVINHVKGLEGELRGLGLANNATRFLTTSGILLSIVFNSLELTFIRDGNADN
ncbi:hypothetical protein B0H19DRAFT_1328080 [Mycena capillaripes]|nr:hypothetical protein B0H19DRAFT_1328080 [Mycena capillaripes]